MATQITITSGVVEVMNDWENPSLQVYTTKTNNNKAFVIVKATLKDPEDNSFTDADWAVVSSIPVGSGTYVFKINNTTAGVNYTLEGENCTITDGYYQNE